MTSKLILAATLTYFAVAVFVDVNGAKTRWPRRIGYFVASVLLALAEYVRS